MISEYVQQNQGPVMRREEIEEFSAAVEDTRESIERLEARIREMEVSQE
jgi:ubiquinone biosynthesis protein UbiJ